MIEKIKKFVLEAGQYAIDKKGRDKHNINFKWGEEAVSSMVTEVDLHISKMFRTFVEQNFSHLNYMIIDEESLNQIEGNIFEQVKNTEYQFILDPIDGTINYAADIPLYGVLVSVFKHGKPLYGFMYAPDLDELVYTDGQQVYYEHKGTTTIIPPHLPTVSKVTQTVLDNAHLEIAGKVLSPYASGLACLVDDEKELGATIIDIGGGTTSIATFMHGHPVYFSSIGVGGDNVTKDIAWGLTTSFAHAERLKTLHGCAFLNSQDANETINVYPVGEEDDSLIKYIPKSNLIEIIAPRVEEIFELVNQKLDEAGLKEVNSHRIVLTGGGSQLLGIREVASLILDKQVRLGRPRNIGNVLDISEFEVLQYPSFSTVIGLLLFVLNHPEIKPTKIISKPVNPDGSRFSKIMSWLKNNF